MESLEIYQKRAISIQELDLEIAKTEMELKNTPLYKKLNELKEKQDFLKKEEENQKTLIKEEMERTGTKKIENQNFTLTLKESVWNLKVEDESVIDEKYFRIKKELDKTSLKNDIKAGLVEYPWVSIQKTTTLLITPK